MRVMAGPSALRVYRSVLKELRKLQGSEYTHSMAYTHLREQFRNNKVTGERYCRAQREALHTGQMYLCLLESTRLHMDLHMLYHGRGERGPEEVARLVGLRMPSQPGGKGWQE
ncbi:protein FMC1 homolog [Hoplias malabaricus]|uniref:protein FMC1 homolog n=1 Tax=Hoplias malabaricus TaxID=27720 RepID=UPI003462E37B